MSDRSDGTRTVDAVQLAALIYQELRCTLPPLIEGRYMPGMELYCSWQRLPPQHQKYFVDAVVASLRTLTDPNATLTGYRYIPPESDSIFDV